MPSLARSSIGEKIYRLFAAVSVCVYVRVFVHVRPPAGFPEFRCVRSIYRCVLSACVWSSAGLKVCLCQSSNTSLFPTTHVIIRIIAVMALTEKPSRSELIRRVLYMRPVSVRLPAGFPIVSDLFFSLCFCGRASVNRNIPVSVDPRHLRASSERASEQNLSRSKQGP